MKSHRNGILAEIDASLTRLGTDYVDLYQIHRWDHAVPIEETLKALDDVVKFGKAPIYRSLLDVRLGIQRSAASSETQRLVLLRIDAGPLKPAQQGGGA
jgi:aryl-alcohol dehydrogenase-like predicted oxidoreductase